MKTVIEMAIEAGFGKYAYEAKEMFERFAKLVRADEREDCWQPIETAPKDGTEILVYANVGPMVSFFSSGMWREKANMMGLKSEPSHWMRLPDAPAAHDIKE